MSKKTICGLVVLWLFCFWLGYTVIHAVSTSGLKAVVNEIWEGKK